MKHERNVEGLRQNAQKKRQEAIKRTDAAIQKLLKDKRPVNFKTVAEVAGVSTAWLYREPEIKTRIERLREQGSHTKKAPPQQMTSDASKDAIIKTLKERCAKLDAEIRGLREQLEVVYGRVLEAEALKQQVEQLKADNSRIKEECMAFKLAQEKVLPTSRVTSLTGRRAGRSRSPNDT
jgi:small-conductance mechanosensitive channel